MSSELARICLSNSVYNTPRWLVVSGWNEHIPFAFYLVAASKPRTIVELGTHWGASYCSLCQSVAENHLETKCTAVDTWSGDAHTGAYGNRILRTLRAHHDPLYGGFSQLMRTTFDEALSQFADGSIDLLHIDGFHTYDAVKRDFESWLPKMSDRGIVLLHDTAVRSEDFGVYKLMDELKTRYPTFSFEHGNGLGVVAVGQSQPEAIQSLFATSEEDANAIRRFFSTCGRRIQLEVDAHYMRERLRKPWSELARRTLVGKAAIGSIKSLRAGLYRCSPSRPRKGSETHTPPASASTSI